MDELSYHPLFNEVILNNVFKYTDNISLRLVDPFWDGVYLMTHGNGLHPWFQSMKILKSKGSKFSDYLELKNNKNLMFCKYKGIFVYVQQVQSTVKICFVDFTQQFQSCVEITKSYEHLNYYYNDFVRFHRKMNKDNVTHYLISLRFSDSISLIDYTNLDNVVILKCEEFISYDVSQFQYLFSTDYSLRIHPSNLPWFDFTKFNNILKLIEQGIKECVQWEKFMFLPDDSIIISQFYATDTPLVVCHISNCAIYNHRFNLPFVVDNCHFWNRYFYFEGGAKIIIYEINKYEEPLIQFSFNGIQDIKFVELDHIFVGFSQMNNFYLINLISKTVEILSTSFQIYNAQFFRKINDKLFASYDVDNDQRFYQLNFNIESKIFEVITNLFNFHDQL